MMLSTTIKDTTLKTMMIPTMGRVNLPEVELKCVLEVDMEQFVTISGTMRMLLLCALNLDSLEMVRLCPQLSFLQATIISVTLQVQ